MKLKRCFALLLTVFLLPVYSVAETRFEGEGAATPQELVTRYIEALNTGSINRILQLFAIESYVDNKDLQAVPKNYTVTPATDTCLVPVTNGYTRSMLVSARYGELAKEFFNIYLYAADPEQYVDLITYGVNKKQSEALDNYLTALTTAEVNSWPGQISLVYLPENSDALMHWLNPGLDTANWDTHFRDDRWWGSIRRMWGCDEATIQCVIFRAGSKTYFTAPTVARYGNRWYLISTKSQYTNYFSVDSPLIPVEWDTIPLADFVKPSTVQETHLMEGIGFGTAEEAAAAYTRAWKQGDVNAMLQCFAIESLVDHINIQAYLEAVGRTLVSFDWAERVIPVTGELSRQLLIACRWGNLARKEQRAYVLESMVSEFANPSNAFAASPELMERLTNCLTTSPYARTDAMQIGTPLTGNQAAAELRRLLGNDAADCWLSRDSRTWKSYAKYYNNEAFGCDELKEVIVPITWYGEEYLLDLLCVRYGNQWHLLYTRGYLSEFIRGDYNVNGLIPLKDIDN